MCWDCLAVVDRHVKARLLQSILRLIIAPVADGEDLSIRDLEVIDTTVSV